MCTSLPALFQPSPQTLLSSHLHLITFLEHVFQFRTPYRNHPRLANNHFLNKPRPRVRDQHPVQVLEQRGNLKLILTKQTPDCASFNTPRVSTFSCICRQLFAQLRLPAPGNQGTRRLHNLWHRSWNNELPYTDSVYRGPILISIRSIPIVIALDLFAYTSSPATRYDSLFSPDNACDGRFNRDLTKKSSVDFRAYSTVSSPSRQSTSCQLDFIYNPDIMRFTTTTEDSGLMSESEYEVISNDTESQDGNYTESMGESIGSLGLSRPDDVQSHTGTEQTYDDESVTDECDIPAQQTHQEESGDIVDSMETEQTPQIHQSWASVVKNGPLPEVEAEPEVGPEAQPDPSAEQEPESEDEARSRSSLEYTQQSLKTPSIPSPDASITEDKPNQMLLLLTGNEEDAETQRSALKKWLKETQRPASKKRETIFKMVTSPSTISAVLLLVLVPLIGVFLTPLSRDAAPHIPAATSAVTNHPTLITSSRSSLPSQAPTATVGGSALIPVQDAPANDWPWSSHKINVTVERHEGNFLLRMPRDVKKSWLDRDCLNFNAKRGGEHVRFGTSSTDEGIILKIPKEEAHGMVKIDMYTTCRPRIHKVLRVAFEKGIISEALDLTWSFAQRVPELVPAAAQRAERRLEEARRSLETASCNFKTTSGIFCKDLGVKFHDAHRSLGWIKKDIKCRSQAAKHGISAKLESIAADVKQYIPSTEAVQNRAELELLNAQIAAKLWWLKLTAGDEEHDRYERAAKQFMTKKQIKQLLKNEYARKSATKAPAPAKLCRFWLWSGDSKDRAERQKA